MRICQVCRKNTYKFPKLVLHSFPKNLERRRIWYALLGFSENKLLPQRAEICTDHFIESDFLYKRNKVKYLKPDANPKFCPDIFEGGDASKTLPSTSRIWQSSSSSSEQEFDDDFTSIFSDPVEKRQPTITTDDDVMSNQSSSATESESEGDKILKTKSQLPPSIKSKITKRKKRYVRDLTTSDFSTLTKGKDECILMKRVITEQEKKIKLLRTNVSRLRKKINTFSGFLTFLKEKLYISEVVRVSLAGSAKRIFERMLKGPSTQKYEPSSRLFSLTLAFYSPRAYIYVRNTFNKSLPHLRTISKWYPSVDGRPGFTKEALATFKLK